MWMENVLPCFRRDALVWTRPGLYIVVEIAVIQLEKFYVYHSAKIPGNFGKMANVTVIFRKIRLEIVGYLQRYSWYSGRNGISEIEITSWLVSADDFYSRVVKNRKRTRERSERVSLRLFKTSELKNRTSEPTMKLFVYFISTG